MTTDSPQPETAASIFYRELIRFVADDMIRYDGEYYACPEGDGGWSLSQEMQKALSAMRERGEIVVSADGSVQLAKG